MLRQHLKYQAKGLIASAKPKPVLVALIYILAAIIISILLNQLTAVYLPDSAEVEQSITSAISRIDATSQDELSEKIANDPTVKANVQKYVYGIEDFFGSPIAITLYLALLFVSTMLRAGFTLFALNTTSGTGQYSDLLGGFGFLLRLIGYLLLRTLFIFLWSLLFFIPGIIAAYRYKMALYILIEHPEYSVLECFRQSKRMMKHHKWELFVADMSFIGWDMLVSMLGIFGFVVQIWYLPYYEITIALYYRHLSASAYGDPAQPVIEI